MSSKLKFLGVAASAATKLAPLKKAAKFTALTAAAALVAFSLNACGGGGGSIDELKEAYSKKEQGSCDKLKEARKAACDKGDLQKCFDLAEAYSLGRDGLKSDGIEAISLYKKACDGEHAEACFGLSGAYIAQGDRAKSQDMMRKALGLWEKECDKGNIKSCGAVGEAYASGKMVEQDLHKGLQLLQKFCDKVKNKDEGDISHCLILGSMYAESKGTTQDYEQAKKYYKKVCDMGVQDGCDAYKYANEQSSK